MKKNAIFTLITLIFAFALTSCSCNPNLISDSTEMTSNVLENDMDYDLYNVSLGPNFTESSTESTIFKIPIDDSDDIILKNEIFEKSIDESVLIGKKNLSAKLIKVETHSIYGNKRFYVSQNDNVKFWKYDDFDHFGIDAEYGEIISEYPKPYLTENDFINHIDSFLSLYLNLTDYTDYKRNIITRIGIDSENGYWTENHNGFYKTISNEKNIPVSSHKENVLSYEVEYIKEYEGIRTQDRIWIQCDESGNITDFSYYNYDVDWSCIDLNYTNANNLVTHYIPKIINTDYCELSDYEISYMSLAYKNNEVILTATVKLDLILKDPIFENHQLTKACIIRFSPS